MPRPISRACAITAAAITSATLAGPLAPPVGAPSPTNKTLQEVEPRNPISVPQDSSIAIVIPGSYYLTDNISTFGSPILLTEGVTLDLNGFTISGVLGGTENGIFINAAAGSLPVTIKNGKIRNFGGDGVTTFGNAIRNITLQNVIISNCADGVDSTPSLTLIDCVFQNNRNIGARTNADADVRGCKFDNNVAGGLSAINATVTDSVALNNGSFGFQTALSAQFTDCYARSNSGAAFDAGPRSTATNCLADSNPGHGFRFAEQASLTNCRALNNTSDGFQLGVRSSVTQCSAISNFDAGFRLNDLCVVEACHAAFNAEEAFILGNDARITNCHAESNNIAATATASIEVGERCHVDANSVNNSGGGGIAADFDSVVIRNSVQNSIPAYGLPAGVRHGPVEPDPELTTNPWANFSF